MTDQSFRFPNFSMTLPAPCPYLAGRLERKIFTELAPGDADSLNEALTVLGFRRSQNIAYKPACDHCSACVSVRIPVKAFRPTRSMRKIRRRNRDVLARICPPSVSGEQYRLMRRYLNNRHPDGGMAHMDAFDYGDMVEDTSVSAMLIEYRLRERDDGPGKLIGAALTDEMSDSLSMVYSFFDPDEYRRSLGTFIILSHIQMANQLDLDYVYLGYWIENCDKMSYKQKFQPLEGLGPDGWERIEPPRD